MYRIYISTFGKPVIHVKGGTPIEVGASGRECIYPLTDNTGVNISNENPFYGELTGLFWIWKNTTIQENDIIGYCHYNKALNISEAKITKWLADNPNGMMTIQPTKIRNHPNRREIQCLLEVLKRKYPESYAAWNKLYDEEAAGRYEVCRGGNMFIAKGSTFNAYCNWLFDILRDVRMLIGDSAASDANMRRYCAFMGERLLSVFIETYSIPVLSVDVRLKKWWLPFVRKVVKYLHINRNSYLYIILRDKFGYSSQYGRKI